MKRPDVIDINFKKCNIVDLERSFLFTVRNTYRERDIFAELFAVGNVRRNCDRRCRRERVANCRFNRCSSYLWGLIFS